MILSCNLRGLLAQLDVKAADERLAFAISDGSAKLQSAAILIDRAQPFDEQRWAAYEAELAHTLTQLQYSDADAVAERMRVFAGTKSLPCNRHGSRVTIRGGHAHTDARLPHGFCVSSIHMQWPSVALSCAHHSKPPPCCLLCIVALADFFTGPSLWSGDDYVYLWFVGTDTLASGKRLGTELIEFVLAYARSRSLDVKIDVSSESIAAFYTSRFGFRECMARRRLSHRASVAPRCTCPAQVTRCAHAEHTDEEAPISIFMRWYWREHSDKRGEV